VAVAFGGVVDVMEMRSGGGTGRRKEHEMTAYIMKEGMKTILH